MFRFLGSRGSRCGWLMAALGLLTLLSFAQTPSPSSITGTVTDPQGKLVSGAIVTITNRATAEIVTLTTPAAGTYASGVLAPGNYYVHVEAPGYLPVQMAITVQVTKSVVADARLALVQSVHVQNLPMNGRSFLDLAQLEPEVQVENAGRLDPTKNGSSSLAIDDHSGRAPRIEADGIDLTDETVGASTQNLPLDAVHEPVVVQAAPALGTPLASSGTVSLTTRSGGDQMHGGAFYNFRDQTFDAALPGHTTTPFERNQFGAHVGGAVIKDRLFFFLDAERNKQDQIAPAFGSGNFFPVTSTYSAPLRETEGLGRLDYKTQQYTAFYRFSYDQAKSTFPFIPNSFQPFVNSDHSADHVLGVNFDRAGITHSVRFGFSRYSNGIADAVGGSSIYNPAPGVEIAIGTDANCITPGADDFCSGPNYLAPQTTFQSSLQLRYDGLKLVNNHQFHFGGSWSRIHGGGTANFLGSGPEIGSPALSLGITPPCVDAGTCPDPAGGYIDPLNYPALNVNLSNGQAFMSEKSAFGLSGGGIGPDTRIALYGGDIWKVSQNVVLTYGLNYIRDTARTDSDLGPIAALYQFDPVINTQYYNYIGLGNRVRQPNLNLSPQFGFAWDAGGTGHTMVRGGAGIFYNNSVWNNLMFDRPARLASGLYHSQTSVCSGGTPQALSFSTTINPASICGQPIGDVAALVTQLQSQYQAASAVAGANPSATFIGNTLADGVNINGTQLLAPAYQTPRSLEMNLGIQHEIRAGNVFTVDIIRRVSTHDLMAVDTNHVGDYRFFDPVAALAAVNATVGAACGAGTVTVGSSAGAVECFIANNPTATISAFAVNGLDSGYSACGGHPCALVNRPAAAFPGINSAVGANQMLFPSGRSVYQGEQGTWKEDVSDPFLGVHHAVLTATYTFSHYSSTSADSDLFSYAPDYSAPLKYMGPNGLDRRHQFSFGTVADLPVRLHLTALAHFASPLASSVTVPVSGQPGGIFQTDITGDGTGDGSTASNGGIGDLLPGTRLGAFQRNFDITGLNQLINDYNQKWVGTLTPAGQILAASGLFTNQELTSLQAVIGGNQAGSGKIGPLLPAQNGMIGQQWFKSFDLGLDWSYKVRDRIELLPSVKVFNVLNMVNFDGAGAPFTTVLDALPGSPNGTRPAQPNALRLGLGSDAGGPGSPRVIEFGLKVVF